jgi:hypothetical protein
MVNVGVRPPASGNKESWVRTVCVRGTSEGTTHDS